MPKGWRKVLLSKPSRDLAQVCNLLCPENIGGTHHVVPSTRDDCRELGYSWHKLL